MLRHQRTRKRRSKDARWCLQPLKRRSCNVELRIPLKRLWEQPFTTSLLACRHVVSKLSYGARAATHKSRARWTAEAM
eukprot:5221624-Amphidinium_carterae.1